ncbi:MAG: hypothetical protein AAGB24_16420 [Bacteroidota bacterium]
MRTGHYIVILSIFVCIGLQSCASDDTDDSPIIEDIAEDMDDDSQDNDEALEGQSLTAKVNGVDFNNGEGLIAGAFTEESGFYVIAIVAGEIIDDNNVKAIGLAVSGFDFDTLEAGKEWTVVENETNFESAIGSYGEGETINDQDTDETLDIFVRITSIDKENRLISGEFTFIALDEDTNMEYVVTDGRFTDIFYGAN